MIKGRGKANWHDISTANLFEKNKFGVYWMRVVDKNGQPVAIGRVGGTDPEGILYVGRSGYKNSKTDRSLAKRIVEFNRLTRHSGSRTYLLARARCPSFNRGSLEGHSLQYRTLYKKDGSKKTVDGAEIECLAAYFLQFGELPPCNSNFPQKWDEFEPALRTPSKPLKV